MCYDESGLCSQYLDTILGSLVYTIGRAYVISQRERESSLRHHNIVQFNSNSNTQYDNLCNFQLLTG